MTLTLTLVRHGRTHYNARRLLQGWCDSPLTRPGRDGVRATARHLAATPFTAAYASPSGRAVATAVEILRHHPDVPLRTDPDLREYHFGRYEKAHESVLDAIVPWPELVSQVMTGEHPGLDGGEHSAVFLARVQSVMTRIVDAHDDGHVLVVGHGLALGIWLAMVGAPGLVALPNASVSTVRVHPTGVELVRLGDDVAAQGAVAARPALLPA